MSAQTQSTSDALTVKLWHEKLRREIPKNSFFEAFMGNDGSNIVHVKDIKGKGDTCTFGLAMRLNAPAKHSGESLEGSESVITTYSDSVSLDEQNFAVASKSPLDRKRPIWDMDAELRHSLIINAAEKRDQLIFDQLYTGTLSKILYGGTATSTATLTTSDKLTPELISKVKTGAKNGWARSRTPMVPIRIAGKDVFVLLVHDDSMYDLKQDSRYDQARRDAMERSDEHPLFMGADTCWWDGVIIKSHENVPISLTGGAGGNVPYAKNVLLGAQAILFAWGEKEHIVEATMDYTLKKGYASLAMYNATRATYNSNDFGVAGLFTARTSISDA